MNLRPIIREFARGFDGDLDDDCGPPEDGLDADGPLADDIPSLVAAHKAVVNNRTFPYLSGPLSPWARGRSRRARLPVLMAVCWGVEKHRLCVGLFFHQHISFTKPPQA